VRAKECVGHTRGGHAGANGGPPGLCLLPPRAHRIPVLPQEVHHLIFRGVLAAGRGDDPIGDHSRDDVLPAGGVSLKDLSATSAP
jgi:hypothetical protein